MFDFLSYYINNYTLEISLLFSYQNYFEYHLQLNRNQDPRYL
jgi:hypothetical protein